MTLRTRILALTALLGIASVTVAFSSQLPLSWQLGLSALALLPLVLLAPGLWRGRLQSYRIGSILGVFYVGFALTEVVAQPAARWLPGVVLLAATALIATLIVAIRQVTGQRPP